jgi:predicted metal-dependent hydrolase
MYTTIYNMLIGFMNVSVEIKDIRNVHLSVYPPYGDVKVSAPLGTKLDTLRVYIISKISWIKKQQLKFSLQKRISPRELLTRESHYIRGQRYLMNVIESQDKSGVIINQGSANLIVEPNSTKEQRMQILEKWQRQELKKDISVILQKWEPIIGVKSNKFVIRKMKTRWGSCNPDSKTININLFLIEKPIKYLEYIIVHELVHLIERTHNSNFLAHMDKFLSNWRQLKYELNQLPINDL